MSSYDARDHEIETVRNELKPLRAFANRLRWLYRILEKIR
jgi:hypothetical protein